MPININKLETLLVKNKNKGLVVQLILDYSILKQKIENPEKQSWYFKNSIDASKEKLNKLEKEYESVRKLFNDSTIDDFITKINENNKYKNHYIKNGMNSVQHIHFSSITNETEFLQKLVHLKSKINYLEPINYYASDTEAFLNIID